MKKPTDDLWNEMLGTDSVDEFFKNNSEEIIFNGLEELIEFHIKTKNLKKSKVFEDAMIERHFGYQIIGGTRNPSRNKLIQLCFGLKLNLSEAQRLLKTGGCRELYIRDPRDAVIAFALRDGKSLNDVNIELDEKGLSPFE